MTACVLLVSLVLMGQVGAVGGRYSDAGSTNPFAPSNPSAGNAAAGNPASGNAATGSLVPIIGEPSSGNGRSAAQPSGRPTAPYTPTAAQPGGGNTYPIGGATASPFGKTGQSTPGAASNPWQTNPPAGGASASSATGGIKPSALMRAMLTAPATSRLAVSRVTLADAVASAPSRVDQAERIEAYWDLCSSVADYYLALREQEELARLRMRIQGAGQAWQQAESELAVRVGTSQKAAVASQQSLAALMGIGTGMLPLPADIPHCADYYPHYEKIFAGRASAEAQQIVELLPLRFAELKDATAAVSRSEEWLATVARGDAPDGVETLRALELLALRRRAFVQIAWDYNRRIARYSELATPGEVGAVRLVSMLISRRGASTATRSSAPTGLYNRQSQVAPSLPKTFEAEGWTPSSSGEIGDAELDDAIQQASGELNVEDVPRRERSLLVRPPEE